MLQWAESIEAERKVSKLSLNVERLQALSMIIYYPLEHLWYLADHGVLPIAPATSGKIATWSCRFWMVYTILQVRKSHSRKQNDLTATRYSLFTIIMTTISCSRTGKEILKKKRVSISSL